MIRRCISFILLLCLTLYGGESLVADVHDGDATAEELRTEGRSHDVIHFAAQSEAGAATNDGSRSGGSSPDAPLPGQPVHAQHACHCVHAHGFVAPTPSPSGALEVSDLTAPASHPVRMPPSLEREPQLRPPIAV